MAEPQLRSSAVTCDQHPSGPVASTAPEPGVSGHSRGLCPLPADEAIVSGLVVYQPWAPFRWKWSSLTVPPVAGISGPGAWPVIELSQ